MPLLDPQYRQKLLERLEIRKQQGRLHDVYRLDPGTGRERHYSPQQIIDEARRGTEVGNDFLVAEYKLMKELERRRTL